MNLGGTLNTDLFGATLLHFNDSSSYSSYVMKFLINQGLDIETKPSKIFIPKMDRSKTPLYWSIKSNNLDCVKCLLKEG